MRTTTTIIDGDLVPALPESVEALGPVPQLKGVGGWQRSRRYPVGGTWSRSIPVASYSACGVETLAACAGFRVSGFGDDQYSE